MSDGTYSIVYPSQVYYETAQTLDIIVWTYPIVLAVALWDWITSLKAEYERIWSRPFSLVSILYLGARYWTIVCLCYLTWMYAAPVHEYSYCEKWFRWSCGMTVPIEMFSGSILLVRTFAFTGKKIPYLVLFTCMFIAQVSYMIYVTASALQLIPFFIIGQTKGRCITAGDSTNLKATFFWVVPLLFATILTGITMVESIRMQRLVPSARRSPLIRVFIRDGLMFLLVITITNILNVAFFVQKTAQLQPAAMAFQFLFSSLMSSRLVLSLRSDEARACNSAVASIATKSFWKTQNGNNTTHGQTGVTNATTGSTTRVGGSTMTLKDGGEGDYSQEMKMDELELADATKPHQVTITMEQHVTSDDVSDSGEWDHKRKPAHRY